MTGKRPRPPRATSPLNTHLSPQAKDDLIYLQEVFGGATQREVIQRALAAGRWYFQAISDGKELVMRGSDGDEVIHFAGYLPPAGP